MKKLEKKIEIAACKEVGLKPNFDREEELYYSRYLVARHDSFIAGAKSPEAKEYWQQGMYSGEEVRELLTDLLKATGKDIKAEMVEMRTNPHIVFDGNDVEKWFEQNKKK